MQDDLIAVTQADREARKRFYDLSECGLSIGDMDLLDRILGAHRQQAEDAMRARCAGIAESQDWTATRHAIATAIRAAAPKEGE